jgi:hypothetical protein
MSSQQNSDPVAEQMTEMCKGMFLWINLQRDELNSGLNRKQLQETV